MVTSMVAPRSSEELVRWLGEESSRARARAEKPLRENFQLCAVEALAFVFMTIVMAVAMIATGDIEPEFLSIPLLFVGGFTLGALHARRGLLGLEEGAPNVEVTSRLVGGSTLVRRVRIGVDREWERAYRLSEGEGALADVSRHLVEDARLRDEIAAGVLPSGMEEGLPAPDREAVLELIGAGPPDLTAA